MRFLKNFYDNYICINLKDYQGFDVDLEINKLLFFIFLGISVACFFISYHQQNMLLLLKKLFRSESFGEANAKTFAELGLSSNNAVKGLVLKNSGPIKRVVSVIGKKTLSYEEYIAIEKAKKIAKQTKTEYADNDIEPEIDFSVARFYIAEENRVYAERAYSNNNTSYVKATLSCAMFFVFYLVVVLLMPVILNVASSMM